MFDNSVVLITGGTGSFGNAMLDRIKNNERIKEIRIFSRDEKKQYEMTKKYNDKKIKFYIGDIRCYESINFALKGVDYVFHAAALKQVPSCEVYPMEAVRTNIIGTQNVVKGCIENNIKKAIFLSTDKAVYPINAMGMTKAIMEKIVRSYARIKGKGQPIFCVTRYGNVMGSRGSVIPLFINEVKNNQDITITNPNMTRFLMTLDEAISLVLFAFENGQQGDLFIQKSPAATIETIAKAIKQIFNSKSQIKIIGTRPGEKMHETLVTAEEMTKAKEEEKYYRIHMNDYNKKPVYTEFLSEGDLSIDDSKEYTSDKTYRLTLDEVKEYFMKVDIVKEELEKYNEFFDEIL